MKTNITAIAMAIFAVLAVAACSSGPETLDTSSADAMVLSIDRMSAGYSPDDQKAISTALLMLSVPEGQFPDGPLDLIGLMAQSTPDVMVARLRPYQDWTLDQLLDAAEVRRKGNLEEQVAELDVQIASHQSEATAGAERVAQVQEMLLNVVLSDPRLEFPEPGTLLSAFDHPVISFSITNNTNVSIAAIHVEAVAKSADREVPWVEDELRYSLSGGVAPGETYDFSTSLIDFRWGSDELTEDEDLIVTVKTVGFRDAADQLVRADEPSMWASRPPVQQLQERRAALRRAMDESRLTEIKPVSSEE